MSIPESNAGRLKFFLKDLNSHLVCPLCEGYFREAHTVPDCLHTFCKSCLFKEFAKKALKDAKSCPSCKVASGREKFSSHIDIVSAIEISGEKNQQDCNLLLISRNSHLIDFRWKFLDIQLQLMIPSIDYHRLINLPL